MNVILIHNPCRNNMVLDVLSRQEEFQAMSTIQIFWLVYKGEGNLQQKIMEEYMNNLEIQRLFGELYKGKALKEAMA